MKQGDLTELAKYYVNRPGYSKELLSYVKDHIARSMGDDLVVADVGAGTGKLTSNLYEIGLRGYAIEPNDAMRNEGIAAFSSIEAFEWREGSAEKTGLEDSCVNWVLMGSSFHWAEPVAASNEFKRILKPGGYFTAIWNPRNITSSPLHMEIEEMIKHEVPELNRVSSGKSITTEVMEEKLGDNFDDIVFMEAKHEEVMTKERYINTWRSVNDIQAQAGPERFERILRNIEEILKDKDSVVVPYKSRAWTAKVKK